MLGRTVAVKVLAHTHAGDEETLRRFKNEAQSAARLDHENVARVYYVGEDQGLYYIVYEFIEGTNIRDLVASQGPFSLAEAISYTLQIAETLAHAAARDVVHRDIKPSNILVTPHGQAKLVDMGLARLHRVEDADRDLTASGVTLGTFDFISPEQARDPRSADVRSDMYSLGCTFYYMLTGRPPFPDGTMLQKLLQHQGDEPPDPREFRPELPEDVTLILHKLLAKAPGQRYQQPAELIAELLLLAQRLGLPTSLPSPAVWMLANPPRQAAVLRHLPWALPIAMLVVIVAVLNHLWRPEPVLPPQVVLPAGNGSTDARRSPQPTVGSQPLVDAASTGAHVPAATNPERGSVGDVRPPIGVPGEPRGSVPPEQVAPTVDSRVELDPPRPLAHRLATSGEEPRLGPERFSAALAHAAGGASVAPPRAANGSNGVSAAVPPDVPTEHRRSLVVRVADSDAARTDTYATLQHALDAALIAAVRNPGTPIRIELWHNGPRASRPVNFEQHDVTIAAGEGYEPVLVFRPDSLDPETFPRSMITVRQGRLALEGVHVALELPRVPAEGWALVNLQGAEQLRVSKCTLTIRNAAEDGKALHRSVVLFDIQPLRGSEEMMMMSDTPAPPLLTMHIADTLARGEATILQTAEVQPLRLDWSNGLIATSERLLEVRGAVKPPPPGSRLKISFEHVTLAAQAGLCRMTNSKQAPHLLTTEIESDHSIFVTAVSAPLIEQSGMDPPERWRERLYFSGSRNFYHGATVLWRIWPTENGAEPEDLSLTGWRRHWSSTETPPRRPGPLAWQGLPPAERPPHRHGAQDYALDPSPDSPARDASLADRGDAGADLAALPRPPENLFYAPESVPDAAAP
jgi:eukaryotic-like serine/threonine-protein kinase